jgi:hypothetical protein
MTQLNLSGSQNKIPRTPAAEPRREITNQTLGAMGALVVFAAVIIVGSCSQGKKPAAVQQAAQPSAPVTTPAPAGATAPLTPVPTTRAAKTRKRRAPILSYVNRDYSVSFSFPRRYQLKTGDRIAGQLVSGHRLRGCVHQPEC